MRDQAHHAILTNSEAYIYYRWAFRTNYTSTDPYIELAELELYIDNGTFFLDPETNNGCAYNLATSHGIRHHRNDGLNGCPFLHMNRFDYRATTSSGLEAPRTHEARRTQTRRIASMECSFGEQGSVFQCRHNARSRHKTASQGHLSVVICPESRNGVTFGSRQP